MQALHAAFFKPNTILVSIDPSYAALSQYDTLIRDVRKNNYGLIYYVSFGTASLAIHKNLTLWVYDLPQNWRESFNLGNNDLAILLSILVAKNWRGNITVNLVESQTIKEDDKTTFKEMIRFPKGTTMNILSGDIRDLVISEKNSDLNIVSISSNLEIQDMIDMVNQSRISGIFCQDSGYENALV